MFKNFFEKMFTFQDSEQVKLEKEIKNFVTENAIKTIDIKNMVKEIKTENKIEMSEELKKNEIEVVQEEVVADNIVQENELAIEDAPTSEETEVVNEVEETEEQPSVEPEGIEPPEEQPVEVEETEAVEETVEEQEEPQAETETEEEPAKVEAEEPKAEVEAEVETETEEVIAEEEPKEEVEETEPVAEPVKVEVEQSIPTETVNEVKVSDVVEEHPVIINSTEKDELLKEIETLKAQKAEKELELVKMSLSKEVEKEYSGVPGRVEDKVDFIYEIQNSALSENSKQFILNSLKSLSKQNISDCEEIGIENEVEVDENKEREDKVAKAMKEHGLTYNQAFLYVNGDRTLNEAKKFSQKIQKNKK